MIRIVFAVAAIALAASIAVADQDPIAARRALMKANGDEAKAGVAMIKGEAPFDLAKAHRMFETFESAAQKMPGAVPGNIEDRRRDGGPSGNLAKHGRLQSQVRQVRRRR